MTLADVIRETFVARECTRHSGELRDPSIGLGRWSLLCWLAVSCGTSGDLSLGRVGTSSTPNPDEAGVSQTTPPDSSDRDSGVTSAPLSDAAATSPDGTPDVTPDDNPTPILDAGSEVPEASPAADPCSALGLPTPSERFDLSGTGTEVIDSMGGPSGRLLGGAELSGQGQVELDGDDDYIDLPNGLLSSKTSATIVLWVSLIDGPAYWRILDFGAASEGEDSDEFAVGTTYVAITTETGLDPSGLALLIGHGGASSEDRALTSLVLERPMATLAVVLDGDDMEASLYVDGDGVAQTSLTSPLSEIDDFNNWLGRSQYSADPHYPGTYEELRLYDEALSPCQVSEIARLPPDATQ